MPYASEAQRRFFHSQGAKEAGISPKTVEEFDTASKGKHLPERKGKTRVQKVMDMLKRGMQGKKR